MKGLSRRRCAVRRDADDLAEMIAEILRLVARPVVVAERDEQVAVGGLRDAAAVVIAGGERAFLAEDHLHVAQARLRAVVEFAARHGGATAAAHALRIAEIDRAVAGVILVERDIEQAALAGRPHLRHAVHRRRELAAARDDAQPSRALGHQHASVGQEGEAPRRCEPARHRLDLERAGRGVERGACAARRRDDHQRSGQGDRRGECRGDDDQRGLHDGVFGCLRINAAPPPSRPQSIP